jgi:hypothetical protein
LQRKNIQTVIQVFAKATRLYFFFQIPIRGCDDSHIRLPGSVLAYAFIAFLLENTQQLALELQRDFTDLIQEQGATRGNLKPAGPVLDSPGEGAPGVPEKFAFKQFLRH